jgi:glycosyltransferase involved in cell wall biosynthesis
MAKRITWIVNNITLIGGIERVVCNLSNFFQQNGYKVRIVSLNSTHGTPHFELNPKVSIEHLGYPVSQILNRKQLKDFLGNFLKDETDLSDILITCHPWIAMPILQQKNLYKGKIICTEHSTWESYSRIRRVLNSLYYRKADQLVVLTENAQRIYQKHGVKNPVVIPNIITYFPKTVAPLDSKELISGGRLTAIKGFDRLIQAIALIKDDFAPWHLTIYGDGEEHDRLVDLIHQNHLEELVSIEHFTDELQKKLHAAAGFIISSRGEAFPMVALEALANGIPVISYDIPSLREIDGCTKTLIIAKQGDVADLAAKIKRYISAESHQKRGEASRKLAANYSLEKVGEKWLTLIGS